MQYTIKYIINGRRGWKCFYAETVSDFVRIADSFGYDVYFVMR